MANKSVTFSLNIVDNATGKLKSVTAATSDLKRMVKSVTEEVRTNQRTIVDWAQAAQAADALSQSVSQMYAVCKDLTQTYQVQLVAETQLVTIKAENAELRRILDEGEDAIIERIAREQDYAKPNERIFIDISGK